jgi:hypothetical protein
MALQFLNNRTFELLACLNILHSKLRAELVDSNLNVVSSLLGLMEITRYCHSWYGRSNRRHSDSIAGPAVVTGLSHRIFHDWLFGPWSHLRQKDRTSDPQPTRGVIRLSVKTAYFSVMSKNSQHLRLLERRVLVQ